MVTLNENTANKLAKLFVQVQKSRGNKQKIHQLREAVFQAQNIWLGTY